MAVSKDKWGILYCPKRGLGRGFKQWQRIQRVLDERRVEYDFVQSEKPEGVERLVKMLINNGYQTIVIVGGDSALNDAVNCLMEVGKEERERIALGVIPNGVINDFARYWGFRETDPAQTVDWLLKRRVRRVDLGCIRYKNRDDIPFHRYPVAALGRPHEPSVDAHQGVLGLAHLHLVGAVGMDVAVVEEATREQKPDACEELGHLGVVDYGNVEQPVVGHGAGRLAVTWAAAHAHGHHLAAGALRVYAEVHLVLHAMEEQQQRRHEEG